MSHENFSVQLSHSVLSNSLQPHGLEHARLPCPSPKLPKLAQTHVRRVSDAIQSSHLLSSPSPPAFNLFQHQSLFQWVSSSHQVANVFGVSASASVLPMKIQDWFPLGLTGLISLQSKGLSRVSGSSAFSKTSLNIWKFSVHTMLKPCLENFEHYFAREWDECNCEVVWAFFGIAFLWDWNKNWSFPVLCHCWVFQICWHIECSTFTASSFRIWNSSTGIPSPPLALFVVMLSKAYLTSHSRMSGSNCGQFLTL